ncbi:ABC transporter ATP-binding protein [Micropruina sonneratiae]|uniref:ABC transporter ATP-binding protein n=1 Tax=Micropruina sonneratiae TaxID=2986940 RepID=UPI002226F7C9|nr:ABC transporter ATP-binding protein [Micropruina sp. KQZ13P-5]MCW3158215.1 ABC transporter ATP-binding protein [Micropruina sp. KQZ13P-5]
MTATDIIAPGGRPAVDEAAIEVRGLRRSYVAQRRFNPLTGFSRATAHFEAVRGIDLRIARGELFALLGTNGAGKTSTVELVEGLSRPSGGTVRVLGHDPFTERRLVRHRTGVVLQSSGFPPGLTVREQARYWAGTLTAPRPSDPLLEAVGLAGRLDVQTAQLSGGERRRLDIALAIMGEPEVLILDEPTTGLDPESRRMVWALIRELVDSGVAVLLTTHYLEEAESLADRLAIMHAGRIARTGTMAELVADQPAQISFGRPADLNLASLALPGARLSVDDDAVRIETTTMQRSLAALLAWAGDVQLTDLQARSASLEQVFLAIANTEEPS